MIVRIYQVTIHAGQEAAFEEFFRNTAMPHVASQPGLVSMTVGMPMPETPREFSMVMVWRDLEALKAFAGDDWRHAHVHPTEQGWTKERRVQHYALTET